MVCMNVLFFVVAAAAAAAAAASYMVCPRLPPPSATSAAASAISFSLRLHPRPGFNLNLTDKMLSQSHPRKRHILAAAATYEGRIFAHEGSFMTSSTSIGSPPVGWTAFIDTGSDIIWRRCLPCKGKGCQPTSTGFPIFDPSSSSSFSPLMCSSPQCQTLDRDLIQCNHEADECRYEAEYGDGSTMKGSLVTEAFRIEDSDDREFPHIRIPSLVIGCTHDFNSRYFVGSGFDGIIGLGRGPLSLTSQLGIARFSYCLQALGDSPSKTSPLLLGDGPAVWPYESGSFASTALLHDPDLSSNYVVTIEGIIVGDTDAIIPSDAFRGGVTFDTGAAVTFLPEAAYLPVMKLLSAGIAEQPLKVTDSKGLQLCYSTMPTNVPTLKFRFGGGAMMELPVDNYVVDTELAAIGGGERRFCISLVNSNDASTIGNIQQHNFHILYDTAANMLSFVRASCDQI